jgi:cation diffusion facilitator CzcD-associated flavoprotein CzcO
MAPSTAKSAPKVAIVGAGLTGLLTAHGLKKVCVYSQEHLCDDLDG